MSTTFFVVNGPTKEVQDIDWDGNPAFDDEGKPVTYREDVFSINMNDLNTKAILDIVGSRLVDGFGSWAGEELLSVRRRIAEVLGTDLSDHERQATTIQTLRQTGPAEGNVIPVGTGMKIFVGGLDSDGIRYRLEKVLEICTAAIRLGSKVNFC